MVVGILAPPPAPPHFLRKWRGVTRLVGIVLHSRVFLRFFIREIRLICVIRVIRGQICAYSSGTTPSDFVRHPFTREGELPEMRRSAFFVFERIPKAKYFGFPSFQRGVAQSAGVFRIISRNYYFDMLNRVVKTSSILSIL
jgi:hypothetical protein